MRELSPERARALIQKISDVKRMLHDDLRDVIFDPGLGLGVLEIERTTDEVQRYVESLNRLQDVIVVECYEQGILEWSDDQR
jgi:chemotaxis regulatin CheY-phosphate phosphatase CheZ